MPTIIISLLGLISFALLLGRWRYLLHGLFIFIPFSGILVFWSDNAPLMVLAKDILYVLPLLIAGAIFNPRVLAASLVPAWLTILITLFALVVILQMMNPGVLSLGMALIGLKVWLLYIHWFT